MHFAAYAFRLDPQQTQALRLLAEQAAADPALTLLVEGHSDASGRSEQNQVLSSKRAQSVKAYLAREYGISGERIRAVGLGDARPAFDNSTAEGRSRNRRVCLSILRSIAPRAAQAPPSKAPIPSRSAPPPSARTFKAEAPGAQLPVVPFAAKQMDVTGLASEPLDEIGRYLSAHPGVCADINGRATGGSQADNLILSQIRAENVKRYLVDRFDIFPQRLKAFGLGEAGDAPSDAVRLVVQSNGAPATQEWSQELAHAVRAGESQPPQQTGDPRLDALLAMPQPPSVPPDATATTGGEPEPTVSTSGPALTMSSADSIGITPALRENKASR